MVPLKEHNPLSPESTWVGECQSRLSLPIPNQQNRLHLNPIIFQATDWLWGPWEVELFATLLAAQFS